MLHRKPAKNDTDSPIVRINGIPVRLKRPDLDKDGDTEEEAEDVYTDFDSGTEHIIQPTELGESMRSLDDDSVNPHNRMSKIDFNARIHHTEKPSVDVFDALISMGMLTKKCQYLSIVKKRNSVSEDGKGREEKVAMVVGKREQDAKAGEGFGQKIARFVGIRPKTNENG